MHLIFVRLGGVFHFFERKEKKKGGKSTHMLYFECFLKRMIVKNPTDHGRHLGGGGGDRGTCPPHVLKDGGHNIKCPPPTFFEHVCVSLQKSYRPILINLETREGPKIMHI